MGFSSFSQQNIEEAQTYVQQHGMSSLKGFMEKKINAWKETKLKLAITGQSGAGKSSFINKIRNLKANQDGAAKVGVTETTEKPTCYTYPKNKNIELWDLPGVGTRNFPQATYLKDVGFEQYDCFIILSETRFTENDEWLARSVLKGGKRFYFVRTKIDNALRDDEVDKGEENFKEEDTLFQMRIDCISNLSKIDEPGEKMKVYLLTNRDIDRFDFPDLLKHLVEELPDIKKEVMIRALSHTSKELVQTKKNILHDKLWITACLSGAGGMIPVPGLSVAIDVGLLVDTAKDQREVLGVDEKSLQTIAESNGMTLQELQKKLNIEGTVITNPGTWIKTAFTSGSAMAIGTATEEAAKYIPFFGQIISGGVSAATTYYIAEQLLKEYAEIAERCFEITAKKAANDK